MYYSRVQMYEEIQHDDVDKTVTCSITVKTLVKVLKFTD